MDQPWSTLPKQFLEQIDEIIPEKNRLEVLESLCIPRRPSFRINTLKADVDEILINLKSLGFKISQVDWCREACTFDASQKIALSQAEAYASGKIYFQSLSSIFVSLVLAPDQYDEVFDMCAAPGSKTSHIAALMQNKGAIVANDNSKSRVFKMQKVLRELGVLNVKTINIPGEWAWKKYPEMFDKVLVDVPCSMEGRFVAADPTTYEHWKPSKGKILSQKQKYLLRSAISCTKPGGVIIYSTCTLSPRENEEVIDWILEKEKNIKIEEINIDRIITEKGILSWHGKAYNPQIIKTSRINPSKTMEGFYLAKIRKN